MRRRLFYGTGNFVRISTTTTLSPDSRFFVYLGLGFVLVGIILTVIGVLWWQNVRHFVQTAERTEGTVIKMIESRSRRGNTTYSPVVEFTDQQGLRREFRARGSISGYSVGGKVPVLYDRERPDSAAIDDWFDLHFAPLVFCVIGVGFIFVMVGSLFKRPKNREKGEEEPAPENGTEEEPAAMPE